MARQVINTGTNPNDGTGESLRGFTSAQNNMNEELYALQSDTINAGAVAYAAATNHARVQLAINDAVLLGKSRVYVPAQYLPYDASLVTFNTAVQMTREGGDNSLYEARAYGAAGNGTADDAPAVLAQITSALANGAAADFSPGVYLLASWSALTTTVTVRLLGHGATLRGPASGTVNFLRPTAPVELDDLAFDRWGSVLENTLGVDVGTPEHLHIRRCVFTNCTTNCINYELPLTSYVITDNRFTTMSGAAIRIGENIYANQDDWLRGIVRGNIIRNVTGVGSQSAVGILVYGRDCIIVENEVENVQGASGEGWGIYVKLRYGTVANNVINTVSSTSSTDVSGIAVKGELRGVTVAPQNFAVRVIGNTIRNVGVSNTKGLSLRMQCDDVLCALNDVEDGGFDGITLDSADGSHCLITNNKVRFATATGTTGIRIATGGTTIRCVGNQIVGAATGIRMEAGTSGNGDHYETRGNVINCSGSAILFNTTPNMDYVDVCDNIIVAAGQGVQFSGGTLSNVRILDNDLRGATTKIGGSIPSGTRIRNNAGYVSENGGTTAAIATGATVAHGMNGTPTVVIVTPQSVTPTDVNVSAIGATTFVINFGGGGSHAFSWEAKLASHYV